MSPNRLPAAVIWALGLTQVVGYGTLYYAFSVLAPAIGREFAWPPEFVFGALSLSLIAGGLIAPVVGHWADRFGAGRVMAIGSVLCALALVATALAPNGPSFVAALVAMELAASLVLYSTAFAALVQLGGSGAQRSITHLTLIAGLASTLFWPLTAALHEYLSWREVYLVFAGLNLVLCLPVHAWLALLARRHDAAVVSAPVPPLPPSADAAAPPGVFPLMLVAFAIEGLILAAILMHMVPLMQALGLAAGGVLVTTLFGPAQVLSRLLNMLVGNGMPQVWLAVIAASLPPLGLAVLLLSGPSLAGALCFAVLFGLGSGLTSIVGGSLPLELFGRKGYGARLGWVASARQLSSAVAPFLLALTMSILGIKLALWWVIAIGGTGVLAFLLVAWLSAGRHRAGIKPAEA